MDRGSTGNNGTSITENNESHAQEGVVERGGEYNNIFQYKQYVKSIVVCQRGNNVGGLTDRRTNGQRKVNRIAGDSNAHRIKDILPDDIAVKCLPISDENM
ncbi:hypothetical protein DPMN_140834 [Dreissena polymorpha]|uniref:Uncharacterized protein n=1 Tax=Dreissena polymorpha TaxID=45954 RepID=A0A9D4JKQ5_DREPO|nr:hypothetical protein DPMN_140834 [Dreissena polymorpha]